jgi:D-glycerate 3-kinase
VHRVNELHLRAKGIGQAAIESEWQLVYYRYLLHNLAQSPDEIHSAAVMEKLLPNVDAVLDLTLPQILKRLEAGHHPVIIGVTGLQGSGKSTWATGIVDTLQRKHNLPAIQVSLDDFYLPHDGLVELRARNPNNELLRTRGQPGTHDEELASSFFAQLRGSGKTVKVPSFDKSRFNGEGDRMPEHEWEVVATPVDVVVFEGWCVGFQAISVQRLQALREAAAIEAANDSSTEPIHTLYRHSVEDLEKINQSLERYYEVFMGPQHFDCFIQLATEKMANVYKWRKEQEHALIKAKGSGMTDCEVALFVQGYMPTYELCLDQLNNGLFAREADAKQHIRVLLGPDREVTLIHSV